MLILITECEFMEPFKICAQSECLTSLTLVPALLSTVRWKEYSVQSAVQLLQKQTDQLHCTMKEIWETLYPTKKPNIIETHEMQESY